MPAPDWPASAEQIAAARRFLQQLPSSGTVIAADRDVDGLSAAVLTSRVLARLGCAAVIVAARRGEHVHTEVMRARLQALVPAALVVVDMGSRGEPILARVPTLVIDHHQPRGLPPAAVMVSAFGHPPVAPTSLLAFHVLRDIADVEDLAWLALLGTVADASVAAPFPILAAWLERYGRRDTTEAVALLRRNPRRWSETLLAEPADWDAHEQAESSFLSAEATRLLYVAATRAAELLVVSRWAAGKGAQPWAAFDPHLARARELAIPAHVPVPARALGDLGPAAQEAPGRQREAAHAAVCRASWRVESVTATTHKAGPVGRPLQAGRTREPDTGVAWGTLVHGLLEAAMRGPQRDRAHLERVARWLTMDNAELRRVVPEALDTVERVMASDFWQRAMAAEEHQVEMPCAVRVDGRVLFGMMDLAFRDVAGWHVIDYKTDQATVKQLVERYGRQAGLYAQLMSRLTRMQVAYAGLYSVRLDTLSESVVTGESQGRA
jgi:hypothetical protein